MKLLRLLPLLAAAGGLAFWCCSLRHPTPSRPEVTRSALDLRDGRLYPVGRQTPFAGFLLERYPQGNLKSRSAILDGRLNGVSEGWHTNGMLQVREHFKDGISDGLREKWYEDGTKLSEVMVVEGRLEGPFRRWDEAGRLVQQIQMRHGVPDGMALAFAPNGSVKTEVELKAGKIVRTLSTTAQRQ